MLAKDITKFTEKAGTVKVYKSGSLVAIHSLVAGELCMIATDEQVTSLEGWGGTP